MNELHRLVFDLDDYVAKLLVNIETLENVHYKLMKLRQQQPSLSNEGPLLHHSNNVLINILDDLLFYTLLDLKENYEAIVTLIQHIGNTTSNHSTKLKDK